MACAYDIDSKSTAKLDSCARGVDFCPTLEWYDAAAIAVMPNCVWGNPSVQAAGKNSDTDLNSKARLNFGGWKKKTRGQADTRYKLCRETSLARGF